MASTVWKGYLSFGLVSFPVRLLPAARAERIPFHMLHEKDHSRIKEVWYCAEENRPVPRDQIVKGYEHAKNEYVVIDDEDLKKIAPPTASTMEVLQFVKSGDVDPIFFEGSYYLAPDDKIGKPFALFRAALSETKHHAIAKIAMHNREHVVLIRAEGDGIVLHTLYYLDELHRTSKAETPKAKFASKELELAKSLITKLSAPFRPAEFHDVYRESVERLIEQKKKGHKVTPITQPKKAPVIDLMDALKRSLESRAAAPRRVTASKKALARRGAA